VVFLNPFLGVRMNRVIKISEVKDLTTLSNATIYRLIKLGEFPKQLKLAERSSGWLLEEINNWLESKRINRDEVQS
jgi:prophage regulatory protein